MATFDYTHASDALRRLRQYIDDHTPGPSTALSLMGGPMGWMTLSGVMPTARILNGYEPKVAPTGAAAPAVPQQAAVRPTQPMPPVQGLDLPMGVPVPQPRPQMAASPSVPIPQARPAVADDTPQPAPQPQPDTSFFMRNALMMRDPNGGGYIDPTGAASVRGPDLISKMMGVLHNKATG